jgi:hypothetical protein
MTSHSSSFAPWATAAPSAPAADSTSSGNASGDALERAVGELTQAAAQLADLVRQNGTTPAANGGSGALALQVTVNTALGDDVPFSASSLGPDLSLVP